MAELHLNNVAPKNTADAHYANTSNPHSVTKSQVGLSNVTNTSDADKPVSTLQQAALDLKQSISTLFDSVMALVLTGFTAGANTAIAATDTLAQALAKIQGQINARPNENATSIAAINHGAAEKSSLVDTDEITGQDSAASFSLIRTTWTSIKAFLKTYFDTLYTATTGWVTDSSTWTFVSADAPTFIFSFNKDMTGILSAGMRLKIVQGTTKYFLVKEVGTFGSGVTNITIDGGTDYTLVDTAVTAITAVSYSSSHAPQGFPISPSKWDVVFRDTTFRTQATPVAGTWYNLGSVSIVKPLGEYQPYYQVLASQGSQAGDIWTSLSTSATVEGDHLFSRRHFVNINSANIITMVAANDEILSGAKATYYLITKTGTASASTLNNSNDQVTLVIRLKNLYL